MIHYLGSRAVRLVTVMTGLIVVTFVLTHVVADPVGMLLPIGSADADRARLAGELGLDGSVPSQLWRYLGDLSHGDLGYSVWQRQPTLSLVLERVPASLLLAASTLIVSLTFGLSLGIAGALRPGSWVDRIATLLIALSVAVPDFLVGIALVSVVAVSWGLLPTSGYGTAAQLVLPVLTLSILPIGRLARVSREAVAQELSKAYVTAARARGLSMSDVVQHHVLKAVLAVTTTVAGYDFLYVFTGQAAAVETIFNWPGLGKLAIDATLRQDVTLVSTIVLFSGLLVMVVNSLLDVFHATIDRRVAL